MWLLTEVRICSQTVSAHRTLSLVADYTTWWNHKKDRLELRFILVLSVLVSSCSVSVGTFDSKSTDKLSTQWKNKPHQVVTSPTPFTRSMCIFREVNDKWTLTLLEQISLIIKSYLIIFYAKPVLLPVNHEYSRHGWKAVLLGVQTSYLHSIMVQFK